MKIKIIKKKKVEEDYKGIDNVLKTKVVGDRTGLSLSDEIIGRDPSISDDTASPEYRDKVEKFFRSKKFERDAKKFFGGKVFPNSNVYVVPFIGNEHAAYQTITTGNEEGFQDMMSDPEINKKIPKIDSEGKYGNRFELFDLSEQLLTNLKIKENTISQIDLNSDIVFVPVATVLKKTFFPSVHMIIHSMFDSDMFADWMNEPSSNIRNVSLAMSTLSDFDANDSDERAEMLSMAPTTKALKNDLINTSFDYAAEVMTGALLYKGGISKLKFDSEMKQIIKNGTNEFKAIFPGKIVLISVS